MKTKSIILAFMALALSACGALPQAAAALSGVSVPAAQITDSPDASGSITVTGRAEVKVIPDEVIITLGVVTFNEEITTARTQNDDIVQRVYDTALAFGIEAKNIQTDYINLSPRYDYDYERQQIIGYDASKTIAVTLHDLTKYESFITAALDQGVNYILGVDFRTTELRKYRDQAREMAITAAQEKAAAMAQGLSQEIGAPLSIVEGYDDWYSSYGRWWGGAWNGAMMQNSVQSIEGSAEYSGGALLPGQISITASVTVSFDLQ